MRQSLIRLALLAYLPVEALAAPATNSIVNLNDHATCLDEIPLIEREEKLPEGLLLAIALAESGRRDRETGLLRPWAWTVNSGGVGHHFENIDDAKKLVEQSLHQQNARVDVGCMQINLFHHPQAFRNLAAAFDPQTNVTYAAKYLNGLHRSAKSWNAAIASYHAGTADSEEGVTYLARVFYYWKLSKTRIGQMIGDTEAARYRGFIVEDSPQPLDLAAEFFVKKDYDLALTIYRASLEQHPDDVVALSGAAECLKRQGNIEEARNLLLRAMTRMPEDTSITDHYLRLIATEPAARRLNHLYSAREVSPRNPQIHAQIAGLLADSGNLPQAVAAMASAVKLAPQDPSLLLNNAVMLDRSGDFAGALNAYQAFFNAYQPESAPPFDLMRIKERYRYLLAQMPENAKGLD